MSASYVWWENNHLAAQFNCYVHVIFYQNYHNHKMLSYSYKC